ncbi:MAG: protein kinase [Deltaproteobacteria bacterium]|nr:protein kinase [Deltaproteobacteria bacterium]
MKVDPQAAREASLKPWIGRMLADKYRIVRVLGTGGHAAVFEATHVWTRRRVAVKIQSEQIARSPEAAARFLREARAAASLAHPSIVEVLDMGRDGPDGPLYLVQEFLDGGDLRQLLNARGRLSPAEAAAIVAQVARGLAVAHQRGVFHRDVKPGNILLSLQAEGQRVPKMIDFGISRMDDGEAKVTTTGVPVGTPGYMSPEQALGERAGAESDIWALGIVLYECLTGRRPFSAANYTQLLRMIISEDAPRVEVVNPEVPSKLADITHRALCRDLSGRFASMDEFADALGAVAPSLPDGVLDENTHIRMAPAPDPSLLGLGSSPPRADSDRSSPSLFGPTEPELRASTPHLEPPKEPPDEPPEPTRGSSIPSFAEGSGGSMRFPPPTPPVSLISFADDTFSQEPTRKRTDSPAIPLPIAADSPEGQDLFASESLPPESDAPREPSYPPRTSSLPPPESLPPPVSYPPALSLAPREPPPPTQVLAPVGLDPLSKALLAFFFLVAAIAAAVGGIWLGHRYWSRPPVVQTTSPDAAVQNPTAPDSTLPPPTPPEALEAPTETPAEVPSVEDAAAPGAPPTAPEAPPVALPPAVPAAAPDASPPAVTAPVAQPERPRPRPRPRVRRRRRPTDGLFWLPD